MPLENWHDIYRNDFFKIFSSANLYVGDVQRLLCLPGDGGLAGDGLARGGGEGVQQGLRDRLGGGGIRRHPGDAQVSED